MELINLSKEMDKAIEVMDLEVYKVVNKVQGGYLSVEEALKQVSEENAHYVHLAGKLWNAIEKLDETEAEAFQELPPQVRDDIKERADALHEEMEAEAKKLQEGRGFFATDDE